MKDVRTDGVEMVNSSVERIPEYVERFIPVYSYSNSGMYLCNGVICESMIEAEAQIRNISSPLSYAVIIRMVLPNMLQKEIERSKG